MRTNWSGTSPRASSCPICNDPWRSSNSSKRLLSTLKENVRCSCSARRDDDAVNKSAQFIEDSDEEYGRDIDDFFAREAELRQRTALAAVESTLNIGTMRPTGTKKRRRAQAPPGGRNATTAGRVAKRRAVQSSSGTPGGNGEGQDQDPGERGVNAETPRPASIDDGDGVEDVDEHDGDDSDSSSRSFLADRDVVASSAGGHRHSDTLATPQVGRPRARPRYQGAHFRGPSDTMSDSVMPETGRHEDDGGHHDRSPVERVRDDDELETGLHRQQQQQQQQQAGSGGLLRKGRLIISDEE